MRYRTRSIRNVAELLESLRDRLKPSGKPYWFRGHAMRSWTLRPSILRRKFPPEMTLLQRFRQDATLLLPSRPLSEFEWLFLMQHHGSPTRLLDWTESPLTALYFAVNEKPNSDGALWILDPVMLNYSSGIIGEYVYHIPPFSDERSDNNPIQAYEPSAYAATPEKVNLPVAAIATRNNERMRAQLGAFTIHHRDKVSIDEVGDSEHVWMYIIPRASKPRFRNELALLRTTKFTLFPELSVLGEITGATV